MTSYMYRIHLKILYNITSRGAHFARPLTAASDLAIFHKDHQRLLLLLLLKLLIQIMHLRCVRAEYVYISREH